MIWLKLAAVALNVLVLVVFVLELKGQIRELRNKSIIWWDEGIDEQ